MKRPSHALHTNALVMSTAAVVGTCIGVAATLLYQRWKCATRPAPRRFGGAIQLKASHYQRYRELHDKVWDDVLERLRQSNIVNFVIYYHKEAGTLFSHFEWIGHWQHHGGRGRLLTREQEDALMQSDMDAIANDPVTRQWWAECEPCQVPFGQYPANEPLPSQGGKGSWWASLECVAFCGHWPLQYAADRADPDFGKMMK